MPYNTRSRTDSKRKRSMKPERTKNNGINKSPSKKQRKLVKKRHNCLEWERYFMAVALLSARRSKDPKTQVGACIVNPKNRIIGVGYNGMPNDCSDDLLPWAGKDAATSKLASKDYYVCHAEMNAIMNKTSADVNNCTIFVSLFPCNECAKLIIQAGIKEVVYLREKIPEEDIYIASKRLLDMAEIQYRKFPVKEKSITINF